MGVAAFIGTGQTHGVLKILRLEEIHVDADVLRQPTGEQSCLLERGEFARVRRTGLERFHLAPPSPQTVGEPGH